MPPRRALVRAAAALTLAATTVTAAAAGPYPPPSTGSASVNPSRIKPGQCTNFSGNGMAAGAAVAVRDDGAPAGSATADRNGAFRLQLCYGTDARTGQHVISGTGASPEGPARTVSAVLTITGVEQSGGGNGNGNGNGGSTGTGTGTGGSTGTAEPGLGVTDPAGVATDGLGSVPRTDNGGLAGGASGVDASSSAFFDGLSGLAAFVGMLLALIASAWLLLLLGRRRREREEDPQALPA